MSINIKGKLSKKLPIESGTTKADKEWKKQSIVIDTEAQFNPLVAISFFGDDKIKMLEKYKEGQSVDVGINISSREFNGKWYHSIDGWKIDNVGESKPAELNNSDDIDDLPF